MLTFDEARTLCRTHARPPIAETVPVDAALGRVIVEDVLARVSFPPFSRALMDGFAVRAEDTRQDAVLDVIAALYAGDDPAAYRVEPGQAIRISTGAPLPAGANAVVRFEWTEPEPGNRVRILRPVAAGEAVQRKGEDAQTGDVLALAGSRLGGPQIAACRTFGVSHVRVAQPPRVRLLITGSELVAEPTTPLCPGQIYAANDALLRSALTADGIRDITVEFVPDDHEMLVGRIANAAAEADYVLVTGGVSAGDRDFVSHALQRLGAQIYFDKVWMRPGTPVILATLGETVVFGLSGNPAACLVQFETLARPAIRHSLGWQDPGFAASGVLTDSVELKRTRHVRLLRARAFIEAGVVRVNPGLTQSSAVVSSLAEANCLVRIDGGQADAGETVPLRWLD